MNSDPSASGPSASGPSASSAGSDGLLDDGLARKYKLLRARSDARRVAPPALQPNTFATLQPRTEALSLLPYGFDRAAASTPTGSALAAVVKVARAVRQLQQRSEAAAVRVWRERWLFVDAQLPLRAKNAALELRVAQLSAGAKLQRRVGGLINLVSTVLFVEKLQLAIHCAVLTWWRRATKQQRCREQQAQRNTVLASAVRRLVALAGAGLQALAAAALRSWVEHQVAAAAQMQQQSLARAAKLQTRIFCISRLQAATRRSSSDNLTRLLQGWRNQAAAAINTAQVHVGWCTQSS